MAFSSAITDQIIFSLDRCSPHWGLGVCRFLYNKPIVIATQITHHVIEAFSSENLFRGLSIPFAPLLIIPAYIGLLHIVATSSSGRLWRWILRIWLLIYILLVITNGLTKNATLIATPLFIILATYGIVVIWQFLFHHETQK